MIETRSPFSRILEFSIKYRTDYIKSVIFAILGTVCGLVPFFLVSSMIIGLIEKTGSLYWYFRLCVIAVIFFFLKAIFAALSTSTSHKATFSVLSEVRYHIAEKLTKVPLGFVLDSPSGKLKNSMIERIEQLEIPLAHIIPEMTSNLTVPLFIVLYMFFLDWRMALAALVTMPIVLLCFHLMMQEYSKKYGEVVQSGKYMSATVVEYINGIEVIKTFNQSASSYKKFSSAVRNNTDLVLSWMNATMWHSAVMVSLMPAVLIGILPLGLLFFSQGSLDLEIFVTSVILSLGIMGPLGAAIVYTDDIAKIRTIMGELGWILDSEELHRPVVPQTLHNLDIEFSQISFSYDVEPVLKGVDFYIKEGTIVALVGASGSGKSTIAKLLAGFWDVAEGSVSIGGVDIKQIPLHQFNELISYVSQDNYLFNTTVLENIRMGSPGSSDQEVMAVAKASGCHDFIMNLEKGYNTIVGGSGGHLSGGERQRIAIARAMMKDAPIIILDEATSYTDPENEALIQESVAKLTQGKTLIIIAHRLSTIIDADQIVLIDNGTVRDKGTHQELLVSSPIYNKMWKAHTNVKDSAEVRLNV